MTPASWTSAAGTTPSRPCPGSAPGPDTTSSPASARSMRRTSSPSWRSRPGSAADGPAERCQHAGRHQPPGVDPRQVDQRGGSDEDHRDDRRPAPVIADDEVVPERADRTQPPPHRAPSGVGRAPGPVPPGPAGASAAARDRRSSAAYPSDTAAITGTITSSAASPPGQATPAPSAPQKVPNDVSMMPTANFMAFSGTRASGARTAIPIPATVTTAAAAARAARPRFPWLSPNVIAMNTTSRPSSSTPLNESVNAYQSRTRPRPPVSAARAAATWRS